jgi:hypothetical protein
MLMTPTPSFSFLINSAIIVGEKPTKGLEAELAPNPNQMNRLTGFLSDGTKIMVCQRPGKGGMDFNKLLGGKVYAVAADGFSPVLEKTTDKSAPPKQKVEKGLPLYSSSGFYSLSSKEYPALATFAAYTKISENGEQVYFITNAGIEAKKQMTLSSDFDVDLLLLALTEALSDVHNCVVAYDESTNKKRQRALDRARSDAEADGESFKGPQFVPLVASKKDGNPFVLGYWKDNQGAVQQFSVFREVSELDTELGRVATQYLSADEAIARFQSSVAWTVLETQLGLGGDVSVVYVTGNVLRTSVSFRKKFINVSHSQSAYGDAVYILAATKQWTKGLLAVMQSAHPNFPTEDYSAHHYVAMCRQAEVGMNKVADKWSTPVAPGHDLSRQLGLN